MSNEFSAMSRNAGEKQIANEASRVPYHRRPASTDPARVEELERENVRLQLLVAELLIKNQQLRKAD